ncbi:hypothetical protein ABW19_dt0202795 [Dactylella cylindrospora]|nr:hypothetical protein ABW19_dt0202795 [Dactylella cylindrospora]
MAAEISKHDRLIARQQFDIPTVVDGFNQATATETTVVDPNQATDPQTVPATTTSPKIPDPLTSTPQATTTSSIAAPYQTEYSDVSGNCQISNFTVLGGEVSYSQTFLCEKLVPAGSIKQKQNTGAIAAAVIFALLFAAAAGLLGFLWWRRTKASKGNFVNHDAEYHLKAAPNVPAPVDNHALQSQLLSERQRVNDLQAALLAKGNAPSGWSSVPSKDDRDVKRAFQQVFNEIKDYSGNYYRGSQVVPVQAINAEAALKEILDECIEGWDVMLGDQKGRVLLVRVVCGEVLRRSWDSGDFLGRRLGKGFTMMESEVMKTSTIQQVQLWRLQTLTPLLPAIDGKARTAAVTSITDNLTNILTPFLPPNPHQSAKQYLHSIVTRLSALYFELVTQNAFYSLEPYISLSRPGVGEESAVFEYASCEDVEQRFEIGRDERGREWSSAEGQRVRGFVFPAVVKHGDGRGGGWEGGVVVVFKAQVFM